MNCCASFTVLQGVVEQVLDKYIGEVSMLGSGDVIRVDQAELETVLPSPGGRVLVVNGNHRGTKGQLIGVDIKRFQAEVELGKGPYQGQTVWLDYEDVCKMA
jgi:DNA/RNA-binding protein KIN17